MSAILPWRRWRRFHDRNRGRTVQALARRMLIRPYTNELVRVAARPFFRTREPERWIFVVGCYNSGTTITRDMLGAHPEIRTMPREGVRFTSVLPQPEDLGWERMWIGCPEHMRIAPGRGADQAARIVKDWSPWWGTGGTAYLDKSITNVMRMAWLNENFRNAYFVGVVRNGYCAAEGIRRRARPRGQAAKQVGQVYPVEMAARQWVEANERLLEGADQVGRYLQIAYEDLVAEPSAVLGRVWRFLELDEMTTKLHGKTLDIATTRFELRDMNPSSLARLTSEEIGVMTPIVADMQARLGYELVR